MNDKSQKNEGNEKNATGKHYNVNIRIQRNELEQNQPASKIMNGDKKDSSINIKHFSPVDINATGPLIKINNNFVGLDYSTNSKIEENRTEIEDINKKYYPQMPELLSEVIQKSRDRSLMLKNNVSIADSALRAENLEARNLSFERKSKRASVRDVVKFIESTYQDTGFTYSPVKPKNTSNNLKDDVEDDDIFFTPQAMDEITPRPAKSVFDSYLATTLPKAPTNQKDQREEEPTLNESLKCLQQASESISRLTKLMVSPKVQSTHEKICKTSNEEQEMISEMNPQVFPIKNLIAASAPPPKKKITTKVTVNFKKISRRSSDVGQVQQFCKMDENGRHAICSNSELVKRFSHQLRMTADANKTSPSHDLVPKLDISANCKMPKYFCKNCGFTMLQTEMLQGG